MKKEGPRTKKTALSPAKRGLAPKGLVWPCPLCPKGTRCLAEGQAVREAHLAAKRQNDTGETLFPQNRQTEGLAYGPEGAKDASTPSAWRSQAASRSEVGRGAA